MPRGMRRLKGRPLRGCAGGEVGEVGYGGEGVGEALGVGRGGSEVGTGGEELRQTPGGGCGGDLVNDDVG